MWTSPSCSLKHMHSPPWVVHHLFIYSVLLRCLVKVVKSKWKWYQGEKEWVRGKRSWVHFCRVRRSSQFDDLMILTKPIFYIRTICVLRRLSPYFLPSILLIYYFVGLFVEYSEYFLGRESHDTQKWDDFPLPFHFIFSFSPASSLEARYSISEMGDIW